MPLTFSELTEQIQQLSLEDLSQLRGLLKKYWIEARRAEIYRHYLQAKSLESSLAEPPTKRVFGQHRGQVWMSPHFDDPLPDPFGFGEETR